MELTASLLDIRFVILLGTLALTRPLWPHRHCVKAGALCSAALVGIGSPQTLLVISSIVVAYLYPLHRVITRRQAAGASKRAGQAWLTFGVAGLLLIFIGFKLHRHFALPWLATSWLQMELLALVGFSYFFFRAISFLRLSAITGVRETSPWPVLYYCLFPPTLTSGPIQRYTDFRAQLEQPSRLTTAVVTAAGYRILRGLFRKLILASLLNGAVGSLMALSPTTLTSSASLVALYLYYYYDFAGYSDMAIGYGLLMGIRVPENFRRPFLATSISEFWRNWHITLVDWFRDHVFITLGGMQSTRLKGAALALLVMVLAGLWHGFTVGFLAWGIWHGLLMSTEALLGVSPLSPSRRRGPRYWLRVLWTNARVAVGCAFFLPEWSSTVRLLRGLTEWGWS